MIKGETKILFLQINVETSFTWFYFSNGHLILWQKFLLIYNFLCCCLINVIL